jgi:hypothetical protein
MSLGLGIFLSSLVLSIVILYGITKDRWSWPKIARRGGLGVLTVVALIMVIWAGIYFWNQLPGSVGKQTEYAGLRIGMAPRDVKYIKGYPPTVFGDAETVEGKWPGKPVIETKNLEQGKSVEDYRDWSYEISGGRIDVEFDADKKAVIVISCYSSDSLRRCPSIGGISDGNSEQEVTRKLGKADVARIDGVTKSLYYKKLAIYLKLRQEQVYMLGVNDTRYVQR